MIPTTADNEGIRCQQAGSYQDSRYGKIFQGSIPTGLSYSHQPSQAKFCLCCQYIKLSLEQIKNRIPGFLLIWVLTPPPASENREKCTCYTESRKTTVWQRERGSQILCLSWRERGGSHKTTAKENSGPLLAVNGVMYGTLAQPQVNLRLHCAVFI